MYFGSRSHLVHRYGGGSALKESPVRALKDDCSSRNNSEVFLARLVPNKELEVSGHFNRLGGISSRTTGPGPSVSSLDR